MLHQWVKADLIRVMFPNYKFLHSCSFKSKILLLFQIPSISAGKDHPFHYFSLFLNVDVFRISSSSSIVCMSYHKGNHIR